MIFRRVQVGHTLAHSRLGCIHLGNEVLFQELNHKRVYYCVIMLSSRSVLCFFLSLREGGDLTQLLPRQRVRVLITGGSRLGHRVTVTWSRRFDHSERALLNAGCELTHEGRILALNFFKRKCAVETRDFDLIGCDLSHA